MEQKTVSLIGIPNGAGAGIDGCQLAPDFLRAAGLPQMLDELGYRAKDLGNIHPDQFPALDHQLNVKNLSEIVSWTHAVQKVVTAEASSGHFPIFLGGDHSISFGTISGMSQYAKETGRPLFVLWVDAHTDFHSLDTSDSGNIHGMPLAYLTGDKSFEGVFPDNPNPVEPSRVCVIGIRSVDPAERQKLSSAGVIAHDMRKVDELGVITLLEEFLNSVRQANGLLHISLDVDALDPSIAPAVGTTVPGGLTFREAHIMLEIIHDSGLATSLDLVELNPLLDHSAKTAKLLIDLTASLLGRSVLG